MFHIVTVSMDHLMPRFPPGSGIGVGNTSAFAPVGIMGLSAVNLKSGISFLKLLVLENWGFFLGHVEELRLVDLYMIRKTVRGQRNWRLIMRNSLG